MATNDENSVQDAEMAECDGEKVVTMMDVLQEQQDIEEDANAVLGGSDAKNCTYVKGYVKRQALYACMTCCGDAKEDPSKRAGTCLACSLVCHENHEVIELYTKRNFRCDCGNPKFNSHPCQFNSFKNDLNEENNYNQNFSGLYCTCHRPYPDPESKDDDDMIQCVICEDWYHATHLEVIVPANDQYSEMVCKDCMDKNMFLHDYSHLAICLENADIDVMNVNNSSIENVLLTKCTPSEACDTVPDIDMADNSVTEKTQSIPKITINTNSEEISDNDNKKEQATGETKENIEKNSMEPEKIETTDSGKELLNADLKKSMESDKIETTESEKELLDTNLNKSMESKEIETTDSEKELLNPDLNKSIESEKIETTESQKELLYSDLNKNMECEEVKPTESEKELLNPDLNKSMEPEKIETTESKKELIDSNLKKSMECEKIKTTEPENELLDSDLNKVSTKESDLKEDLKSDPVNNEITSDELQVTQVASNQSIQLLIEKAIPESTQDGEDTISQEQNETDAEKLEEDLLLADPSPEEEQELINRDDKDLSDKYNKPSENVDMAETPEALTKQSKETSEGENKEASKHLDVLTKNNISTSTETLLDNINKVTGDTDLFQICNEKEEIKKDDIPLECETADKNASECNELKQGNIIKSDDLPSESIKNKESIVKNVTDAVVTSENQSPIDKLDDQNSKDNYTLETSNIYSEDIEINSSSMEHNQEPNISEKECNQVLSENNQSVEKNNLEHKRKLSTEDVIENDVCIKKAKLKEVDPCVRPKGVKKTHNGATFWLSDFRQKLCTCSECLSMYKDLSVLFLIDPEDTFTAYENLGKERVGPEGHQSQYEKGLEALLSLDRIQQINAVTEYNKLRDKLLDFLKSFKDRQAIVKEEDIKAFFADMKPKRESDGVYFCR